MPHMRRRAFWSKEDHARTYRKGAWAAPNDRGAAADKRNETFLRAGSYYQQMAGSLNLWRRTWKMRVSRISALLITAMMIPAISGCTTQGSPAPDAVHQIEDDGPAVYDDDPIAVEPQLDEDELDGDSDESNVQGEIISAEPHKGSAEWKKYLLDLYRISTERQT